MLVPFLTHIFSSSYLVPLLNIATPAALDVHLRHHACKFRNPCQKWQSSSEVRTKSGRKNIRATTPASRSSLTNALGQHAHIKANGWRECGLRTCCSTRTSVVSHCHHHGYYHPGSFLLLVTLLFFIAITIALATLDVSCFLCHC